MTKTREIIVSTDVGYIQLPAFKAGSWIEYASHEGGVYKIHERQPDAYYVTCTVYVSTGAVIYHNESGLQIEVPPEKEAKHLSPGQMEKVYKSVNDRIARLEDKLRVTREPTSTELLTSMKERVEYLEGLMKKLYAHLKVEEEETEHREAAE